MVFGLCITAAQAQFSLEADYRGTGNEMLKVFEPQRQVLQVSSALIQEGRTEAGYGVVISPEGHILVKASEYGRLKDPVVIVDRDKYEGARLLATNTSWDVSLIKIEAKGLVPVVYAPTSEVAMGSWVVSNGVSSRIKRRLLMGVVSAKLRELAPLGGLALGVVFEVKDEKLVVKETAEKGGGRKAGIEVGDVMLALGDKPLKKIEDLSDLLKGFQNGNKVPLKVQRGDKQLVLEVELMTKDEIFEQRTRNDEMSGDVSMRRSGFPRVLQHSIIGSSKSVGGPVLDLDSRCVGMNIARANRAESFAIPVEDLKALAQSLMDQAQP